VATFGQPCFLPQIPRQEFPVFRFRLTPTTVAASPGIQSQIPGDAPFRQHSLRISLTASLFQGAEGGAKRFSEGVSSARQTLQIRRSQKLNCVSFEVSSHAHNTAKKDHAYRQANMNSRNRTNIATVVTHRQPKFHASYFRGEGGGAKRAPRIEIWSLARIAGSPTQE
jgi:hypothetical protein